MKKKVNRFLILKRLNINQTQFFSLNVKSNLAVAFKTHTTFQTHVKHSDVKFYNKCELYILQVEEHFFA